jgi:hypothetical protein
MVEAELGRAKLVWSSELLRLAELICFDRAECSQTTNLDKKNLKASRRRRVVLGVLSSKRIIFYIPSSKIGPNPPVVSSGYHV